MSVGDFAAYPGIAVTGDKHPYQRGMTYRQWLIGMIASGHYITSSVNYAAGNASIAIHIIDQADAIIAQLDAEQGK
jgi:hypothetical protein